MNVFHVLSIIFVADVVSGFYARNDTHICCDGNVYSLYKDESIFDCCGNKSYDWTDAICCNDNVFTKPNSTAIYDCCYDLEGGTTFGYDYEKFVCCGGKLTDKPSSDVDVYYSCCNNKIYYYQTQTCCNGKVFNNEVASKYYGCCGDVPYDDENSTCCGDKVHSKVDNTKYYSCCENTPYDYQNFACCNGTVYDSSNGLSCCFNAGVYDPNEHYCNGKYDSVHGYTYNLLEVKNNHSEMCNDEMYDYWTKACCSGIVVQKDESLKNEIYLECCGFVPYNYRSHVCCTNGSLLPVPPGIDYYNVECCDGQLLTNHTEYTCCNDTMLELSGYDSVSCCGSGIYDYTTQFCCNDNIYEREKDSTECCEAGAFDSSTHFCCNGVIAENEGCKKCCYSAGGIEKEYNNKTETCDYYNGIRYLTTKEIEENLRMENSAKEPACRW